MKYRHIVFDIDGTLLDTEEAVLLSLQQVVAQALNRKMNLAELRFALGIPGKDALKKLGIGEPDKFMEYWDSVFQNYIDRIKIFSSIPEVLAVLKYNGYQLGIITSKTISEYQNDFVPFGLASYFDIIICAEHTEKHKPSPEPMLAYIKQAEVLPKEVLYIGDTVYDSQCAKGADTDFILAMWGCRQPEGIEATYFLDTPAKFIQLLCR